MKLIHEINENISTTIEEANGKKSMYIHGPFMMFNEKNRNGRVYPEKVLDKAVENYTRDYIKKNRALGELNHPSEPQVNPERAAVLTTKLWKEGNYYMGKAKVLSTPMGQLVESLMNDGCSLGVSSRGMGSIKNVNGSNEVQEDFVLTAAIDVVSDPSVKDAFVESVYENKNWEFINGIWQESTIERFDKVMSKTNRRNVEENYLKAFELLMDELANK